jgi:hypothetical protein
MKHHFANVGDGRLDGDGIFKDGQVGVAGRAVVEVNGILARYLVIVAKNFVAKSGRLAGITIRLSLHADFVGIFGGHFFGIRRHDDCS